MRLLLLCPVAACTKQGCDASDTWDWLFAEDRLKPKCFREWVQKNLSYIVLGPGAAAWVYWGWQVATLNLHSSAYSTGLSGALVQPFFCTSLALQCACLGHIAKHLKEEAEGCKELKDPT